MTELWAETRKAVMLDAQGEPEGIHEISDDDFAASCVAVVVTAFEHGNELDDVWGDRAGMGSVVDEVVVDGVQVFE